MNRNPIEPASGASPRSDDPRRRRRHAWGTFLQGVRQARYFLLGLAALAVVVVGCIGWLQSEPTFTLSDALYWSVALFTLNAPGNPTTVAPALEVARWGALLVAATTLTTLFAAARDTLTEFDARKRIRWARRLTRHTVIIGDGHEIAGLASSYRRSGLARDVVAIGDIAATDAHELRRGGAIVLRAVSDTELAPILLDASRVIVVGRTDSSTMAMASRIERVQGDSSSLTVLVDDRDLAAQWNRTKNSTSVSRPVRVAMDLLRLHNPLPESIVVPPPVVIGDGPLAGEIARRIVVGWQEPGERLEVHLVGFSAAAYAAATYGLDARGKFEHWELAPHPDAAPRIVRAIMDGHHLANEAGIAKVTVGGSRVYVAYEDDARTVTVSGAIAAAAARAEVVGVVGDGGGWSSGLLLGDNVNLVSSDQLLTQSSTLEQTPAALMAGELEADAARTEAWSSVDPVVATTTRTTIAERIPELLASVGLDPDARLWPARIAPILGPDELTALADSVEGILPADARLERRDLLAFAARLPALAARAGHTPDWSVGHPVILTSDDLDKLAEVAHHVYERISRETRNATGSENAGVAWTELAPLDLRSNYAQVVDIPLKLALCGLTWRRATTDGQEPFRFRPAEEEFLAEVEHERWCEYMIRTGRPGTAWNVAWNDLSEEAKDYDRRPVQAIPEALLLIGIEIVRPLAE